MKLYFPPIDFSTVETLVYHLPEGPSLTLDTDGLEDFLEFELDQGHICDTSEIDGVVHFFPKGNA
ncbi:MAG: hypothetical protein ABFS19_01785 [Thermodesulfobacteriota bacterium]